MPKSLLTREVELSGENGRYDVKESYCLLYSQDVPNTPQRGLGIIGEVERERRLQRKEFLGSHSGKTL